MNTQTQFTPVVASATGKFYKVSKRLGRGVPEVPQVYTKKCSCNRDKTIVFCRSCGYYCNGRIRLKCEIHPRVSFFPCIYRQFYNDLDKVNIATFIPCVL